MLFLIILNEKISVAIPRIVTIGAHNTDNFGFRPFTFRPAIHTRFELIEKFIELTITYLIRIGNILFCTNYTSIVGRYIFNEPSALAA